MKKIIKWIFILMILGILTSTVLYAAYVPSADLNGGTEGGGNISTHTHSYSLQSHTAPTCTASGGAGYFCSCGASYSVTADPLGHNYTWSAGSSAGCTYTGYDSYSCTRCSASYTETIPALGHNWGGWSVDWYPSCTGSGRNSRDCSRCGATDYSYPSAYGHDYEMTQGDSEEHWQDCSRCTSTTGYEGHYDNTYDGYCDACGREWYLPPTAPTITVKDTNGNVLTSTWTNKDMYVYVGGSVLPAGLGGVGYKYQMNGASYSVYSSAVSYKSIQTDTTF